MQAKNLIVEFAGVFDEAQQAFEDAGNSLVDLLRARAEQQRIIVRARHDLEDRQAELLVNGGIEGKNAEERAAKLRIAIRDDLGSQSLQTLVQDGESLLESMNVDLELMRLKLSGCRASRQMALAIVSAITALDSRSAESEE